MTEPINEDERKTLSVLAFLFFRMGLEERAKRVYEAIAELSVPNSSDWRYAKAGLAAVALEAGDGRTALTELKAAMGSGPLSSKEAAHCLMKSQALWQQGRKEEAQIARDEFLHLSRGAKQEEASFIRPPL